MEQPSVSDDLIARRVLQQQQGCESESGMLTINRCYLKHDFSAQTPRTATPRQALRSPLFFGGETQGREQTLRPSASSDVMHSIKDPKSWLMFGTYWLLLLCEDVRSSANVVMWCSEPRFSLLSLPFKATPSGGFTYRCLQMATWNMSSDTFKSCDVMSVKCPHGYRASSSGIISYRRKKRGVS